MTAPFQSDLKPFVGLIHVVLSGLDSGLCCAHSHIYNETVNFSTVKQRVATLVYQGSFMSVGCHLKAFNWRIDM